MRSFSLVLLRRLLFRTAPNTPPNSRITLYDRLSSSALNTLERLLLRCVSHEPVSHVRRKAVDTITQLANHGMARGRPWHALQAQAFTMTQLDGPDHTNADMRESAYRIFAGCPNLVMDLQTDAVLGVFQKGLQDPWSIDVRHAALLASVAYLQAAEPSQLAQSLSLLYPMLQTLPALSHPSSNPANQSPSSYSNQTHMQHLIKFLQTLTPLCTSHPLLFQPHLQGLLTLLPPLILPQTDCGPTPTVARPFPVSRKPSGSGSGSGSSGGGGPGGTGEGAFIFPPLGFRSSSTGDDDQDISTDNDADPDSSSTEDDERTSLRLSALEFMVSLSEARPSMIKKINGWVQSLVRACLEGMGEHEDDCGIETQAWLKEDVSPHPLPDYSRSLPET